jgi:hypothetical protein
MLRTKIRAARIPGEVKLYPVQSHASGERLNQEINTQGIWLGRHDVAPGWRSTADGWLCFDRLQHV